MKKIIIGSIILILIPFQALIGWLITLRFNPPDAVLGLMSLVGFLITLFQIVMAASLVMSGYKENNIHNPFSE